MPGIFTHILSAEEAVKKIESPEIKKLISENYRDFLLGAQGPDFFEYHNIWPWKKSDDVSRMSAFFHGRTVEESIGTMLSRVLQMPEDEVPAMTAYMMGYVLHYCIDSALHPYIYYRTGADIQSVQGPERFPAYHKKLECEIDMLLLESMRNSTPKQYTPSERIDVSATSMASLCRLYMYVCKEVYGKTILNEDIKEAFISMHEVVDYLVDPAPLKKLHSAITGANNKKKGSFASRYYKPENIDRSLDQLNLNRRPWNLTWDTRYPKTSTVPEMFEEGISNAMPMFDVIYKFMFEEYAYAYSMNVIGDKSMYTGLTWNTPMVHKMFELIYEDNAKPVIVES